MLNHLLSFKFFGLFLLVGIMSVNMGCARNYYLADNAKSLIRTHQTLAILPAEVHINNSLLTKVISDEQVQDVEDAESRVFQLAFYNQLLQSNAGGKKPLRVEVQSIERTNKILTEKGYTPRDSWSMTADEIADIVGVDAVVRLSVQKEQMLPDLASMGIDIGKKLLNALTQLKALPFMRSISEKTGDIQINARLYDGASSTAIWSDSITEETTWDSSTTDLVRNMNDKLVKHLPYR